MRATFFIQILFGSSILLSIFSAHSSNVIAYQVVHALGIDIPMTPFTADMTLMISKNNNSAAYYQKTFLLKYLAHGKSYILGPENLGLYEFKAPFQWLSECRENGSACSAAKYFLCHSLAEAAKTQVTSWTVEDAETIIQDNSAGFGITYLCPNK
jgi:hypothetical protein